MKKVISLIFLNFLLYSSSYSELVVDISNAEEGTIPILIYIDSEIKNYSPKEFKDIIQNDLSISGYFNIVNSEDVKNTLYEGKLLYDFLPSKGADYFVNALIYKDKDNNYEYIKFDLHNVIKKSLILSYKINLNKSNNTRKISHAISNAIFKSIVGFSGNFDSKIAYISTEKTLKKNIYKLHVADIDGFNSVVIYKSAKQIMSPTWSPSNDKIAYVSFENNRPEIFIQTLATGKRVKLLNVNKSCSAPAWSPDGKQLAYTYSVDGNHEIFVYDFNLNFSKRITNSLGVDTEAAWSPDSNTIYFTSDRSGKPHIYSISTINEEKAKRITFDGIYNADSNISSDGKFLSFIHNNGRGYMVALYSLKENFFKVISNGNLDEAPSFAPNNKMILFASQKSNKINKTNKGILVVISVHGSIRGNIEFNGEDIREPVWAN